MACRTENKEIGDHEYSVVQWSADKAMLMKFKLIKIFGPSLAMLATEDGGSDSESLSKGLHKLFENNSPEDIVATMKECVLGVAMDGKRLTPSSYAESFSADDIMDIYQIFIFVIKVNYGNLLKGQLAERFLAKMKENL
tara:strand:+ start:20945 stop:21361 length:417 start_codon:yes stop_codon:yes gene_type:complete